MMRFKALVLCSTSSAALALAVTPAYAQVAPASEQSLNSAAPEDAGSTDEVVVTGLRRSLQSAQNIKRNAAQQVDTIVAEDIGKLPDVAISDTAARIPGVQVERGGGEAGRVLIRGLPDFATTYNGRDIFTAETRSVALQDFPAGGIAALEVFKTSTADLVEPGLAGEVNVRSRRPFDFSGFQIAGSAWAQYADQSRTWKPNGNLLITDRWNTGMGDFGALINFSYTRLRYLDSTRSNTDFTASNGIGPGGSTAYLPDISRTTYGSGDRERPSLNGSLQWRPAAGLEFYVDGLWQGFRNRLSDREMTVPLFGGANYSNVKLRPDTNQVDSLTLLQGDCCLSNGFQGGTFNRTNTYQFAIGGKYDTGVLHISADLARTDSTFKGSTESVDYALRNPQTVTANIGTGGPSFSYANFDASDPNNYWFRGFYEENQIAKGKDWQARTDLSYDISGDRTQLQAGFRYTDRDASRQFSNRYADILGMGRHIPISAVPLDYKLFRAGFRGDNVTTFDQWLAPTYKSIRSNLQKMRQFVIDNGATNYTLDPVAYDAKQSYDANEKTTAGYAQLKYGVGDEGSLRVDGIVGLRVVRTHFSIDGTLNLGSTPTPVSVNRSYTDWLPNASARIRFTDQLQLRLSATQTRTRPAFADLNPSQTIDPPPACGTQNTTTCIRNSNGGNPNLKEVKSNNYDASLEYYFSHNGFVSAAAFRRDLNNYVQRDTAFVTDSSFGLIRVNRPFNTDKGRIQGVEGQVNSFFDFDGSPKWLQWFGAQANVTYLDGKLHYPSGGVPIEREIVNISKWAYNIDGYFEHGGLSARLSWNWRSSFLFDTNGDANAYRPDIGYFGLTTPTGTVPPTPGARLYTARAHPVSRLDFSGSYDLTKYLTVTVDATNLLRRPLKIDQTTYFVADPNQPNLPGSANFPRSVRYEESIYSLGVRFRF